MGCGNCRFSRKGVAPTIQIVPYEPEDTKEDDNESIVSQGSSSAGPSPIIEFEERIQCHTAVFSSGSHDVCVVGSTQKGSDDLATAEVEADFTQKKLEVSGVEAEHLCSRLASKGVGMACLKGRKSAPNQDNVLFCCIGHLTVCGIADGHGVDGHWISHWVVRYITALLLSEALALRKMPTQEFLIRAFNFTHEALILRAEQDKFDTSESGSTLSLCCIDHEAQSLVVAWVGDSTCVRGWGENGTLAMSLDHTPKVCQERERIHSVGGQINCAGGTHRISSTPMPWDSNSKGEGFSAPAGNVLRVDAPLSGGRQEQGLAVSRALGDVEMHKFGVIHKPGYNRVRCDSGGEFVLCCSDGIWEHITFEKAVSIVRDAGRERADEAANALVAMACERWLQDCAEDDDTDDTSAVVVWL